MAHGGKARFRLRQVALAAGFALASALTVAAFTFVGGAGAAGPEGSKAAAPAITYKEARAILLSKVIKPTKLAAGDDVIAFKLKRPLAAGAKVRVYRGRGKTRKLKRATWFFWVDDDPRAQFAHATRFVYIDAESGALKVVKQQWWPLVNGKAKWFAFNDYWNKGNWAYSTHAPLAPTVTSLPHSKVGTASLRRGQKLRAAASTEECAVLIDGSGDAKAGFPDDVAGMNDVLGTTLGYTTRKLTPPKNDKADFEGAVAELVKEGCKDMLLYIASHGDKETVDMGKGSYTAADLKKLMEKYPTMEFKIVIQGCKSGSWIAPLGGAPKIIITATDSTSKSYSADPDTASDPNPADKGSEFTSGLIEDLKLIPGDQKLIQRVQECMNTGKPKLVCQLEIAYESAVAKDEDAAAGREKPQRKP